MLRTAFLLGLLATTASADDDDGGEPKPVDPYWIHGSLDGTMGKLGVRFHLDVDASSQNRIKLALPDAGVATGATLVVDGVRHRLALSAADRASAQFMDLATAPDGPHRHWVVQIAEGTMADLDVSIVAPKSASIALDVDFDVPTCFHRDERYAGVPATWRSSVDRGMTVVVPEIAPCGGSSEVPRAWIAFPTSEVSARPFGEPRIATAAMHVATGHGDFSRVEVDLAGQISHVPEDLFTVFLIDASISLTERERDAQAAVIESYVAQTPHSQVQIVAYARKARALLPGWMPASHATVKIAHELETLAQANGSNLDVGLVEASKWLAAANGTRRIVVFSDQRIADRVAGIPIKALHDLLPADTLAHVVAVDSDDSIHVGMILRADAIQFAQLAIASEGMAMQVSGQAPIDALALVRPIALEHVTVHSDHQLAVENEMRCIGDTDLREGDACVVWSKNSEQLSIEGLLWNHKLSRRIIATSHPQLLARILVGFGANLGEADDEIAQLARVVDKAWSLFATWGGSNGFGGEFEGVGFGAWGCGCDSASSDVGIGVGHAGVMSRGSLADQISRETAACHIATPATIELELTMNEIVDVTVTSDAADRDCLTEAVWNTRLALATPVPHEYTTVKL